MAAKPVVNGFDKQLAGRVRIVRVDINSPNGKKIATKVGLDMVPTFIGYAGDGTERWRIDRMPNRLELWSRLISL